MMRDLWLRAMRQCGLPSSTSILSLSPFTACPFLGTTFLPEVLAVHPQLAHLYDVLCAFGSDMLQAQSSASAADRARTDQWLMDVILAGLASAHAVYKKQALFLMQVRQALHEQWRASSSSDSASVPQDPTTEQPADYTIEQWS